MAKVTPISEHFQHFQADLKETFWGDLYGQTRRAWQRFFQLQSERQRDRFELTRTRRLGDSMSHCSGSALNSKRRPRALGGILTN